MLGMTSMMAGFFVVHFAETTQEIADFAVALAKNAIFLRQTPIFGSDFALCKFS